MATVVMDRVENAPVRATATAGATEQPLRDGLAKWGWMIVAVGAALRIARYAANRSLWLDEVVLTENLLKRSFAGLLEPLEYDQGAPIGFLMLQKLSITLFGASEYVLRLVPFLAGLASVPLFWLVARRLLGVRVALFATALFAVCEPLIYYSSEAKQYGLDVAVTLAIVLSGLRLMEAAARTSRLIEFAIVGMVAVWFSHPSVFVLGGIGTVIILSEWLEGRRENALRIAAVAALWVASFAVHYVLFMRHLSKNGYLMGYWRHGFMPWPPGPGSVTWFARVMWEVFRDRARAPVNLLLPEIAIFAFGLGLIGLFVRKRKVLLLIGAPVALTLVAAALGKYPFSERLILFATPLFLLTVAGGVGWVWDSVGRSGRSGRLIAALLAAALLLPSAGNAAKNLIQPPGREELRPVLQHVARHWQEGDELYLYYATAKVYDYYAPRVGLGHVEPTVGVMSREDWFEYVRDLEDLRGKPRVWIVFMHPRKVDGVDEQKLFLLTLNHMGGQLQRLELADAAVYLYDLSGSAPKILAAE